MRLIRESYLISKLHPLRESKQNNVKEEMSDEKTFVALNKFEEEEKRFLRFRKWPLIALAIPVVLMVPLLVYYIMIDVKDFPEPDVYTCATSSGFHIGCGKPNLTRGQCLKLHCCYDEFDKFCFHYIPSKYNYFPSEVNGRNKYHPKLERSPFDVEQLEEMKITTVEVNEYKLQVVLHAATVPVEAVVVETKNYTATPHPEYLAIDVHRNMKGNKDRLLSTSIGPLIASQGYWEWTLQVTSQHLFGLGQLLIRNTTTKVIYKNRADHTTLPVFMAHQNGLFHGISVEHEGPLEVSVLPSKLIVLKSLAGKKIVVNIVTGTTPKDVMFQIRAFEFVAPPRWMLGAHICRGVTSPVEKALLVQNDIFYDSDCIHEDLLVHLYMADADEKAQIKMKIEEVLQGNTKLMISLPPQVPTMSSLYMSALQNDVLYKDTSGIVWTGLYKDDTVAYVDFASPQIDLWLNNELKAEIEQVVEIDKISGFVLTDNWPAEDSFSMANYLNETQDDQFSYLTDEIIRSMSYTIPYSLPTDGKQHYETHNNYGALQLKTVQNNFQSTNSKVFVTSSYQYGLNHPALVQNVSTTWAQLKEVLVTNLYHGLLVHPLIETPVCGSNYFNSTLLESLCIRWYIMAGTMSMFRVASDWPQTETEIHTGFGRGFAEETLKKRDMFSYYYYQLISAGEPIARPMFFDHYEDNVTFALENQYMIGDSLLVAQSIYKDASRVKIYLPPQFEWFEFWGGMNFGSKWINMQIIPTDWIMYIKAGSIVPLKTDSSAFTLAIALDCDPDADNTCTATGSLLLNELLFLTADENSVTVEQMDTIDCTQYPVVIEKLRIYGYMGNKQVCTTVVNFDLCNEATANIPINDCEDLLNDL